MSDAANDYASNLNRLRSGFVQLIGLNFTSATAKKVEAEIVLGPQHAQPYGLVHGGLYCAIIESLCSSGAAIRAMEHDQTTVGLENTTTFMRATRSGRIRGIATPMAGGRRTQVWQCDILDDDDRIVSSGRVRLLNINKGDAVSGKALDISRPDGAHEENAS